MLIEKVKTARALSYYSTLYSSMAYGKGRFRVTGSA
jgi:hypothetical protein